MGEVAGEKDEAAQIRIAEIGWTDQGTNKKLKKRKFTRSAFYLHAFILS
jgi:hypothetical protein